MRYTSAINFNETRRDFIQSHMPDLDLHGFMMNFRCKRTKAIFSFIYPKMGNRI